MDNKMWFINVGLGKANNKKTVELQQWARQYSAVLVDGEPALNRLKREAKRQAEEANEKYPAGKKAEVRDFGAYGLMCTKEPRHNDSSDMVFSFQFTPVREVLRMEAQQPRTAAETGADSDGKGGEE